MLEDVYKSFKQCADRINWKSYNQNDLFFEYIKHENDDLRDNFYAGIVCRYWGYAARVYSQCKKHVPFEQCYDILIDAINYVISHRVWESPESSLYQDKAGPDKAFHVALVRQRGILLASLNRQKRAANFNNLSLDEIRELYDDSSDGMLNIAQADELATEMVTDKDTYELLMSLPVKERIVVDMICFTNWNSIPGVAGKLKRLTEENYTYYQVNYNISREEYFSVVRYFYTTSQSDLVSDIKRILHDTKKNYI